MFSLSDFALVAETIPHIVWVATPNRSVEYLNRQGCDYIGFTPDAASGMKWLSFIHPGDLERLKVALDDAGRGEIQSPLECRLKRHDGEYRWHALRDLPFRGDNGEVLRRIGTATDIEDAKRAETELLLSKQETEHALVLLETLQANSPVGFSLVDRDLRYLRINEALAGSSGLSVSDYIGRTPSEVLPFLWPNIGPHYRHVLETGESVVNVEVDGPARAGGTQPRSWLESYYPVVVNAEIVGVGAIVVDITERKQSEQARSDLTQAAVAAMGAMVEVRDPYTSGHQSRVAAIASAIARELGFGRDVLEGIDLAARIHDIGKVGVPAEILSRPARLSPAEWALIENHAQAGADIVSGINFPWPVAEMIAQHHERLDGSGYPRGLRGDEICLGAKIIAVADIVEAMSSHRPYRAALGADAAIAEITAQRGRLLDPDVVDSCVALVRTGRLSLESS